MKEDKKQLNENQLYLQDLIVESIKKKSQNEKEEDKKTNEKTELRKGG